MTKPRANRLIALSAPPTVDRPALSTDNPADSLTLSARQPWTGLS